MLTIEALASPSTAGIEVLWVVVGFIEGVEEPCHWLKYGYITL